MSLGNNTGDNGFPSAQLGDYTNTSILLDDIVRGSIGGQQLIYLESAGNERNDACAPANGFSTISSPAGAKNTIVVGAVNSNDDSMTAFSSWGPVDDGRSTRSTTATRTPASSPPTGPCRCGSPMAWSDPSATRLSTAQLVSDLDLVVEAPDGVVHRPLVLDPTQPGNNATGGTDTTNVIEMVAGHAAAGTWTVRVNGTSVPTGPQEYTLVVPGQASTTLCTTPVPGAPIAGTNLMLAQPATASSAPAVTTCCPATTATTT